MSIQYIAPVLQVASLERSLAFYQERLGFALEFSYEGFYASVWRQGCRLHLSYGTPTPRDQTTVEREERIDVCLGVEDARALYDGFVTAGVPFSVPLRRMPYGTEFYVRDPDGYILGFVQPAD